MQMNEITWRVLNMKTLEEYCGILEGMEYEMQDYEEYDDDEGAYQVLCRINNFKKEYEEQYKEWTS